MKTHPLGVELRTDGQGDGHDKANSRFCSFANAPDKTIVLNLNEALNIVFRLLLQSVMKLSYLICMELQIFNVVF